MGPKVIVDRFATKAERAVARQAIGRLWDQKISAKALARYQLAASRFHDWVMALNLGLANTMEEMERQLCQYLEELWEEGESKGLAGDTLSGVSHFLQTRRQFPGAWQLLSVWQKLEMPARAAPLSATMVAAMADLLRCRGHIRLCAGLLMGFHCALRTGELLLACVEHFSFLPDGTAILALPWTKGGQRRGAQEIITLDDPICVFWVRQACMLAGKGSLLNLSGPAFRTIVASCLQELHLAGLNFKPYSLRRGGASFDFTFHKDLKRTMHRGRWSCYRTARIYIVEGAALLAQLRVPASTNQQLLARQAQLLRASK